MGDDGEPRQVSSLVLDFGAVRLNGVDEKTASIVNAGSEALTIAQVATPQGSDEAFSHNFETPITLAPSSKAEFKFRFKPTSAGAHVASMVFVVQGAGSKELPVTLKGVGVLGTCAVDPETGLDFGSVLQAASFVRQVRIRNHSDQPWDVEVGGIIGEADSGAFALSDFAPGRYTIPARGELAVPIKFTPTRLGMHEAVLNIPESPMCPKTVRLTGVGVDEALECEPREIVDGRPMCRVDFGHVAPSSKATAEIAFRNFGDVDLEVTLPESALVQPPGKGAPFAIETAERQFTVPAGGSRISVPVSFSPIQYGAQQGSLVFEAPGTKALGGSVELVGHGGGPEIQVMPDPMPFGAVAIDTWRWRKLTVINGGIDIEGTDDDNLRLVRTDAEGTVVEPAIEFLSDTPDEFVFEPPTAYPSAGIPAVAGKNWLEMRVKFSPKSPGNKQAVIRIYSNDPARPVVEVPVQGVGVSAGEGCEYEVRPSSISFGLVEPPRTVALSYYIVNTSRDECVVHGIGLTPDSSDAWVLAIDPATVRSIPSGTALEIPVLFQPTAAGVTYRGAIEFAINSPTKPQGLIELVAGSVSKACLLFAPGDLDFGVVGAGCGSGERTVSVFNVCATNVTIEDLEIQASYSTAFTLAQKPALPATLAPGGAVDFKVSYRPASVGHHSGSIAIKTAQVDTPYVMTFTGRGATEAIQSDVYGPDPQPKVDILLVVDDSSSMSGFQGTLARELASVIRFLNSKAVDYHLAVTTTGVDAAHGNTVTDGVNHNGLFAPLDRSLPTVLTPATPNVEQVFSQIVAVGISGNNRSMLIRPAYLALSAPQSAGPNNAGFLRDEASLAIVVISNADDQDSVPVSFYQNFFLGLKGYRRTSMISFSAIVPTLGSPPAGCSYAHPGAGGSMRVKSLAAATGGSVDEICSAGWFPAGGSAEGMGGDRTHFWLTAEPDLAFPLVVKIDGTDFPAVGSYGETRWVYRSTENAIYFDSLAAPPRSATVDVSYHVKCVP